MTQATVSPTPLHRAEPRSHQRDAITAGARQLRRRGSRALITSACGTGKTLIGIRIAEDLQARRILNVVPTLDLLAQTVLAWRAEHRWEPAVAVSSMDADAHEGLRTHRVGGTSDPLGLARALAVLPRLTIFTTYASLDKIEAIWHQGLDVPAFDLAIIDEAHRVSGRADKTWATIHDAVRIRTDRRLYLTATPRIWDSPDLPEALNPHTPRSSLPTRPPAVLERAHSMDDPAVFGRHVHSYELADAVTDGVLADYQILIPTITDHQLRTILNQPESADARRTTALHLAVAKAITQHRLNHVLVYFNEVEAAQNFAREFPATLRRLPPELRPARTPHTAAIHGNHTPEQRREILDAFAAADCAILTNARVLAEGIDIRSIDAVVFADPTRSVVRCVQALGRALRKPADSPKISSLVIPVYVPPGAGPTDLLGSAYEPVWAIAAALRSHDHRIAERLPNRAHRLAGETSGFIASRWRFDFDTDPQSIARAMDLVAFDPRGPLSRSRRQGLASLLAFREEYGHLAVPVEYVDGHGFATGAFVQNQRDAYRRGDLDADWIAELDAIGMIWNSHDASWETNLATIHRYHAVHGHLAIPRDQPGGAFLAEQRSLAGRGQLPEGRRRDLEAVDPLWELPYGPDWTRKYSTIRAYIRAGHDPAELDEQTTIGTVNAASWLRRQFAHWDALSQEQRDLLTQIGQTPQTSTVPAPVKRSRRTFAQSAEILALYVQSNGHFPGARDRIIVNSQPVMIGQWLAKTRTKLRAGDLPVEHSELMTHRFGPDWQTTQPERE